MVKINAIALEEKTNRLCRIKIVKDPWLVFVEYINDRGEMLSPNDVEWLHPKRLNFTEE